MGVDLPHDRGSSDSAPQVPGLGPDSVRGLQLDCLRDLDQRKVNYYGWKTHSNEQFGLERV